MERPMMAALLQIYPPVRSLCLNDKKAQNNLFWDGHLLGNNS